MKNLTTNPIKQGMSLLAIAAVSAFTACSNPSGSTTTVDSTSTTTKTTDTLVKTGAGTPYSVKPKGPKPMWAPEIEPQMQAVLEKLASYNDKPITQLTAVEARKNHTPTDAVMDLMKEHNIPMPQMKVDTVGKEIPVSGGGTIHARVYIPSDASEPLPVIVYYHGGGYVIANIDVYDASAKALADQVQAIVVSVAYRLAPEHKFPIAHNDSFEAYQWVVKNASSIQGDPKRIAVAGESAGGNLAANMAIMARDKKIQAPLHVLSVYPIASADMNSTSYNKYKDAKPLNKPMMMWFAQQYTNNMDEAKDPRINLVSANLAGLPPFTIINAQLDPLASDGEMLTAKLKAAGVKVDHKLYKGVTHEFFGMGALVPGAKEAMTYAADQLKNALKK